MSNNIKGLLQPRTEFAWSVGLLTVLPLLPLLIEFLVQWKLDSSTVFLTATMYTLSIAFTCDKFWVLLVGSLVIGGLMLCFGIATALAGGPPASPLPGASHADGDPSAVIRRLFAFVDYAYYFAFAAMTFFGYHQIRQRWTLHMTELQPFFVFRPPSGD